MLSNPWQQYSQNVATKSYSGMIMGDKSDAEDLFPAKMV